jgi:molybdenum cofactor cytidylyltransferase
MTDWPMHDALGIDPATDALVATVGGGGKTTLLFALADERATLWTPPTTASDPPASPRISVLTTTTKFTIPAEAADWPIVFAESRASRAAAIEHAWTHEKSAIVVGSGRGERGRVLGVEPDWPQSALAMDIVDFVGVEADGSAGRPFKAPAEHEPVLPAGVSLAVAVVGVGALGRSIDVAAVHRPERVRAIVAGDFITPEVVARVLTDPNGGRKAVPDHAGFAVVVSSAARDPAGAGAIAEACHAVGIDVVVAFDARSGLAERL